MLQLKLPICYLFLVSNRTISYLPFMERLSEKAKDLLKSNSQEDQARRYYRPLIV